MAVRFTNVAEFERDLAKFVSKTGQSPDTVARRLVFELFGDVVERTPVDTGWARANWQIGVGARPRGTPVAKPAKNNVLPAPSPGSLTHPKELSVYWVVNNVPYIIYLEQGRSQQMGKGYMVARSIVAAQNNIKRLLRDL